MTALVPLFVAAMVSTLPAARIDDRPISLEELDAATSGRAAALHLRLVEVVRAEAWRQVDRKLGVEEPPRRPATQAEMAARRGTHGSLEEDVAEQGLRWQIEQEHLAADRQAARSRARKAAGARLSLRPDAALDRRLEPEVTLALAGDTRVSGADVEEGAALALYRLRGELYRERRRRLTELVDGVLLSDEARRKGVEVEDLIDVPPVSDAEVAAYIREQASRGRDGLTADGVAPLLRSRARQAARARAVAALRREATIEVLLEAPTVPHLDGRDPAAATLGPPEARADRTIVLFADYRTTPSRRVHEALDAILDQDDSVRLQVRTFVPAFDPGAEEAAALVRCAAAQGKFAEMRSQLLRRAPPRFGGAWYTPDERRRLEESLDLDAAAFAECLGATETRTAIVRDTAAARALGFAQAPALLVGGRPLTGVQSAETIGAALDRTRDGMR